jgi:hypothetical protein
MQLISFSLKRTQPRTKQTLTTMKTKELIALLQREDPSGEAHVRMPGGVPKYVEGKAGYWDGPYSFIDEDGNWNYSIEGGKVDIGLVDISDFVYDMVGTYNIPTWEDVKSKFKFGLDGYGIAKHRDEREARILDEAKAAYDEAVAMHMQFREDGIKRAIEQESKGFKWFQNKLVDDKSIEFNKHHYYTWKVFDDKGKEDPGSNPHMVEAVYKSGLFERVDNNKIDGYYEWIKK